MGSHNNKLKVTLTEVNAPVLIALGSLLPGVGGTVEKVLSAAARSNGLSTTGTGKITGNALVFMADSFASWMLGGRLILNIPLADITAMYIGSAYLGGYYFTLEYGGTRTDMSAIYGGKAFREQLSNEVRAAGGRVY